VNCRRQSRFSRNQPNDDHLRSDIYIMVIDQISQELESHFVDVNMELISCLSTFNPKDSFASFDSYLILSKGNSTISRQRPMWLAKNTH
jgi:hypothetical protein